MDTLRSTHLLLQNSAGESISTMSATKIDKDYERALKIARTEGHSKKVQNLILEGVKEGHSKSEYALATWYLTGHGAIKKDVKEALRLLKKSARGGVADAWFDLAVCYERGEGVRKSISDAARCYIVSAVLGDRKAVFEAGRLLHYSDFEMRPMKKKLASDLLDAADLFGSFEADKDSTEKS